MRAGRANLRPTGGGTEGRTDVWKFPPVFYRTSALWGRCPKSMMAVTLKRMKLEDDST